MPTNTVSTMRPAGLGRISPRLAEGVQPGPGLAQLFRDLERIAARARQTIETVDHDHILLAHLVEQTGKLRPVAPRSRYLRGRLRSSRRPGGHGAERSRRRFGR